MRVALRVCEKMLARGNGNSMLFCSRFGFQKPTKTSFIFGIDEEFIPALSFAGHFCADAHTRLHKKGAARSTFCDSALPRKVSSRSRCGQPPEGGFERRGRNSAPPSSSFFGAPFS